MNEETFDKYFVEIQMAMRRYQRTSAGLSGPELLALRREENEALLDILHQQKRALALAAGEPVEPMTQFAKSIVTGMGGNGS